MPSSSGLVDGSPRAQDNRGDSLIHAAHLEVHHETMLVADPASHSVDVSVD